MLGLGLLFAAGVGLMLGQQRRAEHAVVLDVHLAQRVEAIQRALDDAADTLAAFTNFLNSAQVDEDSFAMFGEPMVGRDPGLRGVAFDVLVPYEDKDAFEQARRIRHPNFQITEQGEDGVVPVSDRPQYVVVEYIAPLVDNEAALGFDIASEPLRAATINRALVSSEPQFTPPIQLVQASPDTLGFLAIQRARGGLVAGVFEIPHLLSEALGAQQAVALDVYVTDLTEPRQVMYRWSGIDKEVSRESRVQATSLRHKTVAIGGLTWQIDLTAAPGVPLPSRWSPLYASLALAALSILLFMIVRGREREVELAAKSSARLGLALEAVASGVWDWSVGDDLVTLGPSWLVGLGYDADSDPTGSLWRSTLHDDDREAWNQTLKAHLRGDTSVFVARARRRTGTGEWRTCEDRGRIVEHGRDGTAIRVVGTTADVSDEAEREQNEKLEAEGAQHARRLESLGLLAGGVAHDFNNLLTPILACADEVREALPEDNPAYEAAVIIHDAAESAAQLTRQMLEYVGKSSFRPVSADPADAVRDMEGLLRAAVPRSVALEVELDAAVPKVSADVSQLKQVILNLATNAAQSHDGPGSVTIRVFSGPPTLPVVLGQSQPGGACIEVRDEGRGLPSPVERIFDPFFTTGRRGRGLGLSVVQGVVLAHQGAIALSTGPGGSQFQVWLPSAAETPEGAHATQKISLPSKRALRILVVDDDERVRQSISRALRRRRHEVGEAVDGIEAVERAESGWDLVVLDLEMPRMGGLQALPQLQESLPGVPIVLCSGFSDRLLPEGLIDNRRVFWQSKPFRAKEFVSFLESAAEGARGD